VDDDVAQKFIESLEKDIFLINLVNQKKWLWQKKVNIII